MTGMDTYSTIDCPLCGHRKREKMPTTSCQYFYQCTGCGELLKPGLGTSDQTGCACVFCLYGDVPCPPVQTNADGGC